MRSGKKSQGEKYSLSLAGEFYVAAELQRHGIHASVSYGTAKNADVLAFAPTTNRYVKVEVKSTWSGAPNWLTVRSSIKDDAISPDTFWVLVIVPRPDEEKLPEFFVFSSEEIVQTLQQRDRDYNEGYKQRNEGKDFDPNKGVPSFLVAKARSLGAKGAWSKIRARLLEQS